MRGDEKRKRGQRFTCFLPLEAAALAGGEVNCCCFCCDGLLGAAVVGGPNKSAKSSEGFLDMFVGGALKVAKGSLLAGCVGEATGSDGTSEEEVVGDGSRRGGFGVAEKWVWGAGG